MNIHTAMVGLITAILFATPAISAEYQVLMLDTGADGSTMVFEPEFLQIAVGDTVTFVPTNRGHNAETIKNMIPEGAEHFAGRLNEEFSVTFAVEGAYGYKCLPHLAMGMIGLIVVGEDPTNLDALRAARVPPRIKEKFETLMAEIGQ